MANSSELKNGNTRHKGYIMEPIHIEVDRECDGHLFFQLLAKCLYELRADKNIQMFIHERFWIDLYGDYAIQRWDIADKLVRKPNGIFELKAFGYIFSIKPIDTDCFGPVVVVGLPIKITYVSPE